MHTQNPDKFVVVVPEAFSPKPMNETQRRLQAILDYWGPEGERWTDVCGGGDDGGKRCAVYAYSAANKKWVFTERDGHFLTLAAKDMGFNVVARCSDSSFANARKMVLRAIELAE